MIVVLVLIVLVVLGLLGVGFWAVIGKAIADEIRQDRERKRAEREPEPPARPVVHLRDRADARPKPTAGQKRRDGSA